MTGKSTPWQKGYVQVYTGNGKGKTTAAFGLALRAAGAGLPVFIAQFAKGNIYSEISAFEKFAGLITIKQYGRRGCFIHGDPKTEDIQAAKNGLENIRSILSSGKFKVVILDEANIATHFKLISVDELLSIIDEKPDDVELVITGRYADTRVIEKADLVTEMREIKHYYENGVQARKGIES
jgi:cob(I)alamin adenosyltransferase